MRSMIIAATNAMKTIGHRQAIPNQAVVVRRQVVIRRANGSQDHAREDDHVGPALARIHKLHARGFSEQNHETP